MHRAKDNFSDLPLRPPRRVTVVESIIEQLVSLIENGELKPGDRLPSERQLMDMLGVSRSSVREALQSLAGLGLVEGRAGEGTFVKQPHPQYTSGPDISALSTALQKEMRLHLVEAHITLEKGVLLLAAERISDLTRPQIEEALDAYLHADPYAESQAVPQQGKGTESHDRLHLALAEATGNPILVQLERTLLDMVPMSLRVRGFLDGAPADNPRRVEAEREIHTGLCRAVMNGDAQAVLEWLSQHDEFERDMIESQYP